MGMGMGHSNECFDTIKSVFDAIALAVHMLDCG